MKKIIFLQLICIFHLTSLSQQQIQISSNECTGTCTTVAECPPIRNNYVKIFSTIKFCDLANSIVCCPGIKVPTVETGSRLDFAAVDPKTLKFFERECMAYNDRVYPKCESQAFIVGGKAADPAEYPHMALLGAKREDNTTNWFCGGSLISTRYVLSAAHCFYSDPLPDRVRLGEIDYTTTSDKTETQDFDIELYVEHPDYNYERNYNDIVLVKLDKEARLNQFVVPACLPSSNGTEYTYLIAAGWGATKTAGSSSTYLQKVILERFDDKECEGLIDLPTRLNHGLHVRSQMCAGSHVNSSDTCTGDSGGPIFVRHPRHDCMFQLVGITSFSQGTCGTKDVPGVYVRISVYVSWIENIVWSLPAK